MPAQDPKALTPAASATLAGVHSKIERARRHLTELSAAVDSALGRSQARFERDRLQDGFVYRAYGIPAVDARWSLIVGDIVHNIRSALDHLAYKLVEREPGVEPNERTVFPILTEPPMTKSGLRRRVQIWPEIKDEAVLTELEAVQPFASVDTVNFPLYDATMSELWIVHRLDIIDKHRLLLIVTAAIDDQKAMRDLGYDMNIETNRSRMLADGDEVFRIHFVDREPPENYDPSLRFQVVVHEDDVLSVRDWNVVRMCDALAQFVENQVVSRFARFFE